MREILFRGKRADDSEWVEGGYFQEPYTDKEFIVQWNSSGLGFKEFIEIQKDTICQYTGLADKNGNRIWENDIVRIENSMDEGIGNIEFYGGMWYVDGEPSNSLYDIMEYDDTAEIEAIGNIFDNPELMEGD